MLERNRYMVDESSLMIALFNGRAGGTKYTIDWYAPYKYAESIYGLVELPKVVVYDLKNIDIETINYNENLMVSTEE